MSRFTFLGLIACNLVWSANPIASKILVSAFGAESTAWLRTVSAALALVVLLAFNQLRSKVRLKTSLEFLKKLTLNEWTLLGLLGFFSFSCAPLLNMTGLLSSQATDNILIVSLEPLATVILARIFIGEAFYFYHFVSFVLALTGFALLTELLPFSKARVIDAHMLGNLVLLLAVIAESVYSLLVKKLQRTLGSMQILSIALGLGVVFLTLIVLGWKGRLLNPGAHFELRTFLAILYLGPIGTTLTFWFWTRTLVQVSVPTIALTLFVQPVIGLILSGFILHEQVSPAQTLGGALILFAVSVPLSSGRWQRMGNKLRKLFKSPKKFSI